MNTFRSRAWASRVCRILPKAIVWSCSDPTAVVKPLYCGPWREHCLRWMVSGRSVWADYAAQ
eukprot:2203887-Amphidinium_carterae.1